jgi:anti-sigma factor (TIGR02949 family)
MSACDDYRCLVSLFLDHELSGEDAEDFLAHIASCGDCRRFLEEEQALSQVLHHARPLYKAPETVRARVSGILSSGENAGLFTPERLRQRIVRILASPLGGVGHPAHRWGWLSAAAVVAILALLLTPPMVERARADALVEKAAATHRKILEGHLPMEIQTSSPEVVTTWFADKVPFHFQLPESQQAAMGPQNYRLVGSRLISFRGSYAALTTYEMQDQKISLLVVSENSARAEGGDEVESGHLTFHDHAVDGLKVITWSNHGLTYALVSTLSGSARQSCLVCHQNMADHLQFSQHP